MDNLDVAGILQTYELKARQAKSTEQLRDIICDLRVELDLRKVRMDDADG